MTPAAGAAGGSGADDAIPVTDRVRIPRSELQARASRSGGPGGQHVNTSSTRVELLWDVGATRALTDEERARVQARLARRLTSEGVLRIVASETRSQRRNREAAERRLAEMVRDALRVRPARKRTRRPAAANEARLDAKRRRGEQKRERRGRIED